MAIDNSKKLSMAIFLMCIRLIRRAKEMRALTSPARSQVNDSIQPSGSFLTSQGSAWITLRVFPRELHHSIYRDFSAR
ncbi:hypothetical protein [Janthinobacterium sp. LM6]|uniref:hypothetical protein n=1 Tax=Janthinobacterium sp. LM6 TaxID=1938606 RepID=UPI00123725CC|nr:hypothetical protein [Janthinobacterium sp. LM6]